MQNTFYVSPLRVVKKEFINSSPNVCIILYDIIVMSILSSVVVMPLDSGQTGTTMGIGF